MDLLTIKAIFGVISAVAVFIGFLPYLKDINDKKVKPHILSWVGWGFTTAIAAIAMISAGFTWGVLIVVANTVITFAVAGFAILKKVGVWDTSKYDYWFFTLGIIGAILWQVFSNPDIAISFAIFADLSFGIPTLIKVYKDSKSETIFPWTFAVISGLTSLVAVSYISYTEVAYPVYLATYDSLVLFLILLPLILLSLKKLNTPRNRINRSNH